MKVATFTSCVQVSGVPPEADQVSATEVDRWIGVAHEMDFLSPVLVLTFSHNPISVQDSGFVFTDT
jgi:hypothetical protein